MFDLFEKWNGTQKAESEEVASSSSSSSTLSYSPLNAVSPNCSSNSFSQGYSSGTQKKVFVLSVGGSVFFNEKLRAPEIAKFCEAINELKREGFLFVLVVGGGRIARTYQAGVKSLGGNNFEMDEVAIAVTRANAFLFTHIIEGVWKEVLKNPTEAINVLNLGKTPVFGGFVSGQTTDSVAASIAELLDADFINISNVDGIYSADPAKEQGAKMYTELSHIKMVSLLKAQASRPGAHTFVDPHAANILWRSKINSFFINGNDLLNFKSLVRGSEFRGTIVRSETLSSSEAQLDE
ncbi:MAG: UMP kinase [Candidatus Diapherotrites archaeon]|nr:UMP kinase [Candidatus Diapherotrites archaeon]